MPVLELASRPSLWLALLPTLQFWVEQCSHPCSFLETRSPWWAVAAQLLIGFPSILLYSQGWSLSAFITERLLLNGPILRILSTWPSLLFIVIKKKMAERCLEGKKSLLGLHISMCWGKLGQEFKQEQRQGPWGNSADLLAPHHCLAGFLSFTTQEHLPGGDTALNALIPPTPIINPQTWLQASLMKALPPFPLLGWL